MLRPETDRNLALAMAVLRAAQQRGDAPPPGQVSSRTLAAMAGCCKTTIHHIEKIALAKLHLGLTCHNISPVQFRAYLASLSSSPTDH